jgi:hypothetical protein
MANFDIDETGKYRVVAINTITGEELAVSDDLTNFVIDDSDFKLPFNANRI